MRRARELQAPGVPRSGAAGQFVWTRVDVQRARGQRETLILYSAKSGSQYIAKDPLVSTCMGEVAGNVWPRFFYSLSFKSWRAVDDAAAMQKRIAGSWTIATATVADQFVFAPNGRYASAAAAPQYSRVSSAEVLQTTQAYFGNGAYEVHGNAITLTPDNKNSPTESGFIRVEEESTDEGRTWVPSLYLLRTSNVDGKDYEVRYHKK